MVSKWDIKANPDKIQVIQELKPPKERQEV